MYCTYTRITWRVITRITYNLYMHYNTMNQANYYYSSLYTRGQIGHMQLCIWNVQYVVRTALAMESSVWGLCAHI